MGRLMFFSVVCLAPLVLSAPPPPPIFTAEDRPPLIIEEEPVTELPDDSSLPLAEEEAVPQAVKQELKAPPLPGTEDQPPPKLADQPKLPTACEEESLAFQTDWPNSRCSDWLRPTTSDAELFSCSDEWMAYWCAETCSGKCDVTSDEIQAVQCALEDKDSKCYLVNNVDACSDPEIQSKCPSTCSGECPQKELTCADYDSVHGCSMWTSTQEGYFCNEFGGGIPGSGYETWASETCPLHCSGQCPTGKQPSSCKEERAANCNTQNNCLTFQKHICPKTCAGKCKNRRRRRKNRRRRRKNTTTSS